MTDIRAIVPAADYLFMSRFASEEETRFYLKGVAIQPAPVPGAYLVATDGHAMGVMRLESDQAIATHAGFILSADKAIRAAVKCGKREQAWIICREDRADIVKLGAYILPTMDDLATAPVSLSIPAATAYVDGTFPDWRRVMPKTTSGKREGQHDTGREYCVAVNPELLTRFQRDDKPVSFDWAGTDAMLIDNGDERFIGVVMPHGNGRTMADIAARREHVMLSYAKPETAAETAAA